jgi:membrane protein required for beta-lactamase induction
MDVDASIERWLAQVFWPALLGGLAAFAYLTVLARAHLRAKLLIALTREAGRRRRRQEELLQSWGFAPRLEHYRRLERQLLSRLEKEGLRP